MKQATKTPALRWLERILLLVGILCLGGWTFAWLDARYTQYRDGQILDEALSAGATTPEAPPARETDSLDTFRQASRESRPPLPEGALVGRIEIPRLGVSTIVLEGVDDQTLRRGAGHIPETSLPGGGGGNVGIAAHRDSFFRALKDIRKNDIVRLETLQGTFSYRVDWTQIVLPEDTQVLDETGTPALTLVTCYPFYYVGSAPKRFVVRAQRVDDPAAPAAAAPGS